MAVKIEYKRFIQDSTDLTEEEEAAQKLADRLKNEFSNYNNISGRIVIMSSVSLFGQKRRDLDILFMGYFDNLLLQGPYETKNEGIIKELQIRNFVCNIELKGHNAENVCKVGSDYYVEYDDGSENASKQAYEMKFSLRGHLEEHLQIKPFISDFLWFKSISKESLDDIREGQHDNALHSNFSFREFIQSLLHQKPVWFNNRSGICELNNFHYSDDKDGINQITKLFSEKRVPKGLTRKKFEILSQRATDIEQLCHFAGDKLVVMTGRAGTGKTLNLLQIAFYLANKEHNKRCLILTYNRALVSDIQRLIDYMPRPCGVTDRTVSISTIHSFFQDIVKRRGLNEFADELNPVRQNYNEIYETALKALNEQISQDLEQNLDVKDLNWDYILIDEAQDFKDIEKEILFKIYGANNIIVADGVDQFMRTKNRQNWDNNINEDDLYKPETLTLERRQKSNLVDFINSFAKEVNLDWSVRPFDELVGGKVKIYNKYMSDIHSELVDNCKKNECENYDILILEPPTMIAHEGEKSYFKKADSYAKANIQIYDGTNTENRTIYPIKDQCRLYQYDSCRGLEGWCVVCDQFDELISYKMDTYSDEDTLGFDREKAKMNFVYLWSLMPLTRAVDTLVITLKNPDSKVGKVLKKLSDKYDFVEWYIK